MQQILPLFPTNTKFITSTLGVFKKDDIITYLHYGIPIYSHAEDDYRSFRHITSKFILEGLCKMTEISGCFQVSYDSVKRYVKRLKLRGDKGFFTDDPRHGGSRHKLFPAVVARMQQYLDEGRSNCEIARMEKVTEGTVRYAIKTGTLKKTLHNTHRSK